MPRCISFFGEGCATKVACLLTGVNQKFVAFRPVVMLAAWNNYEEVDE
jgi:hypothetical protein